MLSIVVAVGKNYEIGYNNELLWHIPEDLKNFKKITSGKTVIMGRNTFESIGRPLPNRRNIVISRTLSKIEGVEVYRSLEEVLRNIDENKENFIIGGGMLYKEVLEKKLINKIYISFVENEYKADTYFPKLNLNEWEEIKEEKFKDFIFKEYKIILGGKNAKDNFY